MVQVAQPAVISYAIQAAKVGEGGTFDVSAQTWYKTRTPRAAMGLITDEQPFPLEVGGLPTPTSTFRQMVAYGGEMDLIPRMENNFGWLLKATMGSASSVTGKDSDGNTIVGVNTHIFRFDPADTVAQPWLAVRRDIPGSPRLGEFGFDCKVAGLLINVPQMGKVTARASIIGRDAGYDDPTAWTYDDNNYEDSRSTVDSGNGSFTIGGTQYTVLGAQVQVSNGTTAPQETMSVGSYRQSDIIAKTRSVSVTLTIAYDNPDLTRLIDTGTSNGTDWTPEPFTKLTSGAVFAFDGIFQATSKIGATNRPYTFRMRANRAVLTRQGAIELVAGNIIVQQFTFLITAPTDGSDYFQLIIENAETAY